MRGERRLWLMALAVAAGYLALAYGPSVWGTDEARFAGAALNMARSRQYLYPVFNGEIRAHKPILIYWLMNGAIYLCGPNLFACRLPAAIGGALSCLLTGLLGARLFDVGVGRKALWMLALSPLAVACAAVATVDAVLLAVTTGALLSFGEALRRGPSLGHYVALCLLTALGLLLKGPAGLLVPVFIIPTTWLLARPATSLKRSYLFAVAAVLLIAVGLFLLWAVPADRATGGEMGKRFWGEHVLGRALRPMEHHGENILIAPFYYPLVIFGLFFPWTLYLPAAISALGGRRLGSPWARPLLFGWTAPALVLLSLVVTKLPHYALPIWPALCLGAAAVAEAIEQGRLAPEDRRWLGWGLGLMALAGLLGGGAFIAWPWQWPVASLRPPMIVLGLIFWLMTGLAIYLARRNRWARIFPVLAFGLAAFFLLLRAWLVPLLEPYRLGPALARWAAEQPLPTSWPMLAAGCMEAEIVFYLHREPIELREKPEEILAWLERVPAALLFLTDRKWEGLRASQQPGLLEIGHVSGVSLENGRWTTLYVVAYLGRPGAG